MTALDFAMRLDKTAEETEALLGQLLGDRLETDEITRPKRLMDAMRSGTVAAVRSASAERVMVGLAVPTVGKVPLPTR